MKKLKNTKLIVLFNLCISMQTITLLGLFILKHLILCEKKAKEARERIPKQRFLWSQFKDSLSDRNFKRTFRMTKNCFNSLCEKIISVVGKDELKK